jgi:hypothetical protein
MTKEEILHGLSEHYEWTDREQQRIEEKMDEYYNQAIDDSTGIVIEFMKTNYDPHSEYLIGKINQLKKP